MGEKKKKSSKAGTLFVLVILAIIGVFALGWFKPDTPVIGDFVHGFFKKGAAGHDQSGVYTVKVTSVVLHEDEFDQGEALDIQVLVKRVNKDGEEKELWDSAQHGERLATVGETPLSAKWDDRPFEIEWQHGEQIVVEVWDRTGFSDTRVAWFKSDPGDKEFPLDGTRKLTILKNGDEPIAERKGATNQIVFEADRKGPIPAEE